MSSYVLIVPFRVATHQDKKNSDFSLTTKQFSLTMHDVTE